MLIYLNTSYRSCHKGTLEFNCSSDDILPLQSLWTMGEYLSKVELVCLTSARRRRGQRPQKSKLEHDLGLCCSFTVLPRPDPISQALWASFHIWISYWRSQGQTPHLNIEDQKILLFSLSPVTYATVIQLYTSEEMLYHCTPSPVQLFYHCPAASHSLLAQPIHCCNPCLRRFLRDTSRMQTDSAGSAPWNYSFHIYRPSSILSIC